MRKIYFLLFTIFSILTTSQSLFSQVVTIGTGTTVQRQPLTYYFGFGRSSMIYTATEMGTTSGPVSVLTIGFFTNTALNTGPTIIYLREVGSTTAQASATWAAKIASATEVYNGTPAIGVANDWRVISLTTPFPLSPNQNLEVLVETNFGGFGDGPSTGNDIRYSTVTNGHQFWQQDGSAPIGAGTVNSQRPNIRIELGGPILCVAPPGGGTTQGPAGSVCPGSPFSLSITGSSFGTGLTYQWESSADGTTGWAPIGGATNATLNTSQGTTTYYRRKITCSGQDGYSSVFQVTASAPISTLPWTENFDALGTVGATNFPSCWTKEGGDWRSANNASSGFDANARSAPNFIQTAWSTVANEVIWTPGFQLTAGTSYDLSFWYADFDASNTWTISVLYNSTPSSTGATQMGADVLSSGTPAPTVYTNVRKTFVPATSGVYFFAIKVTEPSGAPWWLSFDDFLFELTPPCSPPTGLAITGVTQTTATFSWAASVTPPTGGYEWEIRTSGAPGSGATGLAASGNTLPAVLTATGSGLVANTAYSLYIRTDCITGTLYSAWSTPLNFRTPCNPFNAFPYTETFENASATRDCWWPVQVSGTVNWTFGAGAGNGGTITAAHGGTVNARHFGSGSGSVARLMSPALDFSGLNPALGAQLTFWFANENWLGDQNELRVYYKTSAAGAWTLVPGAVYTTNVAAWTEVELLLPSSTSSEYYVAFEGTELFGWGVAVDDVKIEQAPSCPKPKDFSVLGTTPTTAIASFTSPGSSFIIEYGPVGFVPGTGAAAGAGTIVTGTASPINISGLTTGTTYDFYVRRECIAGVDYSANVKVTASSLCAPVNVPYLQDFSSAVPALGMPTCTSMQDVNGNSGAAGGGRWFTYTSTDPAVYVSPTQGIRYIYDAANLTRAADDWFFIQGLNLTGGTSYRLKFFFKASNGPTWIEHLEVKYGTAAHSSAMTNTLYTNTNIATALASPWDSARIDFTPATTGMYYIGFHALSAPDQAFLYLEDISVRPTPVVDAGVTTLTGIPTCPAPTGVLNATIRNYNLAPLNFATYPITVTATITGAATTTLTTTINSGPALAPGATMSVALPAFNYVNGLYNVTVQTSSADDSEPLNDAYTTSFFVNESPVAATFTPAAPAVCAGQSVQVSTQFTAPAPAPTTMPAFPSGTIAVAVPDNSAVGATHSINVTGVPAGAQILGVSVNMNLTHTWINDIQVNLRAPNGKVLNLFNRKGGLFQANMVNTTISSTSTTPIPATGAPFTGTFAPDAGQGVGPTGNVSNASSFTDLYGAGNGNWTISLRDNFLDDLGTLTSWSITITYGFPNPNVTWAPTTGLFINAAANMVYTGENLASVYAKPTTSTTYTVTTTNPTTGCVTTRTVLVTVNDNPVINLGALPAKICYSDTLVALNATPAGGTWTGRGVTGTTFYPPLTAVGPQPVTYSYTNAAGCTSTATTNVRVEDCPERMIQLREDSAVRIYPNPSDGRFVIQVRSTLYNKLTMRIYSGTGNLVRTQQFTGLVYNRRINVDLTNLPGGSYMVHLSYDGGVRFSEKTYPVIIGR